MALRLIESLSVDFDPGRYHDEYRERVLELVERKAAGEEISIQAPAEEDGAPPDLMAALEASLAEARGSNAKPKARSRAKSNGKPRSKSVSQSKSS